MGAGQLASNDFQGWVALEGMTKRSSEWMTTVSILLADALALFISFGCAAIGRHLVTPSYPLRSTVALLPLVALMLAGFMIENLYPAALIHPAEEIRRVFVSSTVVFLVMTSTTFLWRSAEEFSRSVILLTWFSAPTLVLVARHSARCLLAKCSWWGMPVLVLGSGVVAQRIVRTLSSGMRGVRVTCLLSDDLPSTWPSDLPPIRGPLSLAPDLLISSAIRYVIVAMPQRSSKELKDIVQNYCRGCKQVLVIPDMPGLCSLGVSAHDLNGEVGLEIPQKLFHRGSCLVKRLSDITLASLLVLALFPVLLCIAAALYLTTGGPILYKHKRYGRNGTQFGALKFRTMVPNADSLLQEYLAGSPTILLEWQRDQKLKNDPRVTPLGRIMRRLSLDELPQLFNVIRGDMSLVGPRPIVKSEISKYGTGYDLYQRVLPGITGLWQVSGRNLTTYQQRIAFDEFYVNNWSFWLDMYILVRTIRVVLMSEGAY
jgi:Undecaprenyl-phosphate galactose phosphotransferase WbaP